MTEVLTDMTELAHARDRDRFRKEAMYSERKMRGRLSAKDEILGSLADEAMLASYLRRKPRQRGGV